MKPNDIDAFSEQLYLMAEIHGKVSSLESGSVIATYFELLESYPLDRVLDAIVKCMREIPYMAKPAQIIERISTQPIRQPLLPAPEATPDEMLWRKYCGKVAVRNMLSKKTNINLIEFVNQVEAMAKLKKEPIKKSFVKKRMASAIATIEKEEQERNL